VRKQLRTSQAITAVDGIVADSPMAQAKLELARDLVADLQRIDAQRREVKRRVARAVAAAPTSITDVYGVGPIVAAAVLGYVRDIARFPTRDRFASYNGTAPIEVSSGDRKIYRLSRRGNRQLNHAIHVVAVSQISHRGSEGYAYYQRKRRRRNDRQVCAACAQTQDQRHPLRADAPRRAPMRGPGRAPGERHCLQRGRLTPR
jgi:transposase